MRTAAPSHIMQAITKFDDLISEFLIFMLGATGFTSKARTEMSFPVAMGGLGLPLAITRAAPAFLASISKSLTLQDSLLPPALRGPRKIFLRYCDEFNASYPQDVPVSATTLSELQKPMHWLCSLVDVANHKVLFDSSDDPVKARMLSTSLPFAGGWLLTPPLRCLNFDIQSRTFIMLMKYRMGIPLAAVETKCSFCRNGVLDVYGNHAASCPGKLGLSWRHNRVRNKVAKLASEAGMQAEIEKNHLLPLHPTLRPADIFISHWLLDRGICLDVSIVNPICPTSVSGASKTPASAAIRAEKLKLSTYALLCSAANLDFCPLVMETFGGFGPLSIPILKRISKALSIKRDETESAALNTLCNNLSFVCQRSLGETLMSRYPILLLD